MFAKGLTSEFASELNAAVGDNTLTERQGKPWYLKVIAELTGFFSILLWIASILCVLAYELDPSHDPSNVRSREN